MDDIVVGNLLRLRSTNHRQPFTHYRPQVHMCPLARGSWYEGMVSLERNLIRLARLLDLNVQEFYASFHFERKLKKNVKRCFTIRLFFFLPCSSALTLYRFENRVQSFFYL